MVKVDDSLYLIEAVVGFGQFCQQERLLGSEHLQIGGTAAVFHQLTCMLHSRLQGFHLLAYHYQARVCRLLLHQGVVHLAACLQKALLERQQRFFLLRLGDAQVGYVLPTVEEWLCERTDGAKQPVAGVHDSRPRIVRPACRATQRDARVKGGTCGIGGIECLCQRILRLADVGALAKQLKGYAYRQVIGEVLLVQRGTLDAPRHRPEQQGESSLAASPASPT